MPLIFVVAKNCQFQGNSTKLFSIFPIMYIKHLCLFPNIFNLFEFILLFFSLSLSNAELMKIYIGIPFGWRVVNIKLWNNKKKSQSAFLDDFIIWFEQTLHNSIATTKTLELSMFSMSTHFKNGKREQYPSLIILAKWYLRILPFPFVWFYSLFRLQFLVFVIFTC